MLRTAAIAEALVGNVRSLLRRLRPAELDELGLVAALQALCEAWEARSGVACIFHHADGALEGLGENVDTALYRVTQEALTNVLRHAQAGQVRIHLERSAPSLIELRIEDDGRGFDTHLDTPGLGLLGAGERAAALGGSLRGRQRAWAGDDAAAANPCATTMIRVLLVDDHPVVRAGYQRLLEQAGDITVVAQADRTDTACAAFAEHEPDVTVTDLAMPGSGGLELIRRLLLRASTARILVFSMHDSDMLVRRAFELGARGFLSKSSSPESTDRRRAPGRRR